MSADVNVVSKDGDTALIFLASRASRRSPGLDVRCALQGAVRVGGASIRLVAAGAGVNATKGSRR